MADLQWVLQGARQAQGPAEAKRSWQDLLAVTRWMAAPGGYDDKALVAKWCGELNAGAPVLRRLLSLYTGGAAARFLVRVAVEACNKPVLDALLAEFVAGVTPAMVAAATSADLEDILKCVAMVALGQPDALAAHGALPAVLAAALAHVEPYTLLPAGARVVDLLAIILQELAQSSGFLAKYGQVLAGLQAVAAAQASRRPVGEARRLQADLEALAAAGPRAGGRSLWRARWRAAKGQGA